MSQIRLALLVLLLLPTSALAAESRMAPASFSAGQTLVAASSSPGNSYAVGASVVLTAPVAGDFSVFGGSVVTAAPVTGDNLILAGSVSSRASVFGDFRAVGGSVDIGEKVSGDLFAAGFSVRDSGRVGGTVFIIAANATLSNGAAGPVTIYGNNISLAGSFSDDVTIIASGRITLAASTTIAGKLAYEAPEPATIPTSANVLGGITFSNASYLPDVTTSRFLAFLSIGIFLIVRIIGAILLAGLLAGLFPGFAETIITRVFRDRPRDILLALSLGFAVCVAGPIVIVLLMLTFVGIGLAFLLTIFYFLLVLLSIMYAGIVTGGMLARHFTKREQVLWHDGVLGMAVLSLVSLIPYVGLPIVFFLALFSAGTLLQIFFRFAFLREDAKE